MRGWVSVTLVLLLGVVSGTAVAYLREARFTWDGSTDVVRKPTQQEAVEELVKTAEGGVAQVTKTDHYFGTIRSADDRGQTHSHTFTIQNVGKGSLTLKPGTTTCQCTSLTVEPQTVPAGGVAKVIVEWHVRNSSGRYNQTANVLTNDPDHGTIAFHISGRVAGELQVTPDAFQFTDAIGGEPQEKELKLVLFGDERTIVAPTWSDPATAEYFEFRSEPMSEEELAKEREENADAKNGFHLFVTLKGSHPNGPVRQELQLTLDPAPMRALEIPVRGQMRNELTLIGPKMQDGILPAARVLEGEGFRIEGLHIIAPDIHHPVRVKVAETVPAFLHCDVGEPVPMPTKKNPDKYGIPLSVWIPQDAPVCSYLGSDLTQRAVITLETDLPSVPRMQFEVRFVVSAK